MFMKQVHLRYSSYKQTFHQQSLFFSLEVIKIRPGTTLGVQ